MRLAYIDIGYNALRAVVYDSNRLGSPEIFSEKFKSDILNLLESDDLETKNQTYLAFQYLTHIFTKLAVTEIKCVATAILRGHQRAAEFQAIIYKKFNIEIEILSGEREAYLTAIGLISGIRGAQGLVADLGGGSLEFAEIAEKKVENIKSLALGTKLMHANDINNLKMVTEIIKNEFGIKHYANLYFIGGALRFIGRSYIDFVSYPLKNLHNLEIPIKDFEIYLKTLENTHKIKQFSPYKKIDYYAIIVARSMVEIFKPKKIIISNYGLKEGVRFISLTEVEQNKNIIYEKLKTMGMLHNSNCNFEKYREQVYKLLIKPSDSIKAVIDCAIMLSQLSKNIDKTLKVGFAVEFVLACDIPFTHIERLMLSVALAIISNSKSEIYVNKLAKKLLNKYDFFNSQIIGHFIKIALFIDGPEFCSPSFTLELKDSYIQVITEQILPHLIFDKIFERVKNIAYLRKIILHPSVNSMNVMCY